MVKVKGHSRDLNFNSIFFSETLFSGMEQFIVIFVPENDHCTFLKQILIPINVNLKLFAYDSPCVPILARSTIPHFDLSHLTL